jgi:hypothetical protein
MVALFLRRSLSGFRPDDEESESALANMPVGELYRAEITKPRNPINHRRFFALLGLVYKNTDGRYKSLDVLREIVTIGVGHCDTSVIKVNGETFTHHTARSIAWSKMDETEFWPFWNRAVDYIIAEILPGVGKAELEREVFSILGIDLTMVDRP